MDGQQDGVQPQAQSDQGVMQQILQSIITPGSSAGLITVLNYVCVALLLLLVGTIALGFGDVHVYVQLGLALGLLASVNFFVTELNRTVPQDGQDQQPPRRKAE